MSYATPLQRAKPSKTDLAVFLKQTAYRIQDADYTDGDPDFERDRALYYQHADRMSFSLEFQQLLLTHCATMVMPAVQGWNPQNHTMLSLLSYGCLVKHEFYRSIDPHNVLGHHYDLNIAFDLKPATRQSYNLKGHYSGDTVFIAGYVKGQTAAHNEQACQSASNRYDKGELPIYNKHKAAYLFPDDPVSAKIQVPAFKTPQRFVQVIAHEGAGHEYLDSVTQAYADDPHAITKMFRYNRADYHLAIASDAFYAGRSENPHFYTSNVEECLAKTVENTVAYYQQECAAIPFR